MKRVFALLIVLALLLTVACSPAKDEPAKEETPEETKTEAPATAPEKEKEDAKEEPAADTIKPDILKVQLIPSKDAAKLDAQRKPLEDLLKAQLPDMDVEVTVATDYNGLIEAMKSEKVHVGFLATTSYVLAADQGAAEAILKSLRYDVDDEGNLLKDKPMVDGYKAQLVTNKEAGIASVKDLKDKKIAIASFGSTSGFVWPANLLADNGLDPEKDVEWFEAGGHDKAISAVYNGEADAAFTFKDARQLLVDELPDVREKVIFVDDTSIIPNDTISVIPNLDPDVKEAVKQAFLNIAADEAGLSIMRDIYSHEGYAEASDEEYAQVREYLKRQAEWDF